MASTAEIVFFTIIFVLIAYGSIIFQKAGMMKVPDKFGEAKGFTVIKGMIKNKEWLIGMILNIIGIPYGFFLLSIASLSFVLIVHRAGIILVFIYAIKVLKERMTRTEIAGLVVLYAGFVASIFDTQQQTTTTIPDEMGMLAFFAVLMISWAACYLTFKRITHPKVREVIMATGAALAGIGGTLALKLIPMVIARDTGIPSYIFNVIDFVELFKVLVGVFFPGSGYFAGSIIFYLYMINFTANFFLLMILYQHGRASVGIPIQSSVNFFVLVMAGFLAFGESMSWISWTGIAVMVAGIVLTSKVEKVMQKQPAATVAANTDPDTGTVPAPP